MGFNSGFKGLKNGFEYILDLAAVDGVFESVINFPLFSGILSIDTNTAQCNFSSIQFRVLPLKQLSLQNFQKY